MKLFKNGIELKWLLLAIGIVAISGVAIATTNPYITDSGASFLDALNITRWVQATQLIDADNTAYYIDPSNTGTSIKTAGTANFTSTSTESNIVLYTPTLKYNLQLDSNSGGLEINNNTLGDTAIIIKGGTTSGTDDIACIDPTTKELTKNTGSATTCAGSAEKYKNIKGTFTDSLTNFMGLNPIIFQSKDDIKKLDRLGFSANKVAVLYPQVVYTRYQGNGTFVKVILNQSDQTKADSIQYSDGTIAEIEGINYEMFSAILVLRVQQQQEQLDIQSAQIRNICTNAPQLCS